MTQKFNSEFLQTLNERGYIHQCTDLEQLDQEMSQKTITAYIGFDATADSLHAGSLLPIMMLRRLQQAGHKPLILMGGGTTKIGDPSGKDETRTLLSDEDIQKNINGIQSVFKQFIHFDDSPNGAIILNNDEWLSGLNYTRFLRDIGRHFTVNRMMSFDSVKLRLEREQPLTFLEFNYMIFQAYDFLELNKKYDCILQMGGSDQWGNIVNGMELVRRINNKQAFGLTTPLLTTASGAKMGKSASGAIWLNKEKLSPYDYWQYWRNVEDKDVGKFLKLFTDLSLQEITKLEALKDAEINEAKKILATEVTKLCHGEDHAKQALQTAEKTFEQNKLSDDLPTVHVEKQQLESGIPLFEAFKISGLCQSNGEARRLIRGGGAKVNDQSQQDENKKIDLNDCHDDGVIKLSFGKKKHVLIKTS